MNLSSLLRSITTHRQQQNPQTQKQQQQQMCQVNVLLMMAQWLPLYGRRAGCIIYLNAQVESLKSERS